LLLQHTLSFAQIPIPGTTNTNPVVTPVAKGPFLKVVTDLDCELFIDGTSMGKIKAGEENLKKIPLGKGEFLIVAKSLDGLDKYIDNNFILESQDRLLYLKLKEKRDARLAALQKAEEARLAALQKAEDAKKAIAEIEKNMVYVSGGTFTMGCTAEQGSECSSNEKPAHTVTLSSFSIGKYELTQAQWKAVMGTNPSFYEACPNCPVENVSWNDIQDFISKLNAKTGKTYRLPTEAEWEYAARGGSSSRGYKYAGSNEIAAVAWYDGNSNDKTHPVGQKKPNELGIYDMSGNVWEWCSDWYDGSYYSSSPSNNPQGLSSGSDRVLRGWSSNPQYCRVSFRNFLNPAYRLSCIGFRLVLVPSSK
jgi:formylglycine-generating enzyme required for sulfatase activity